MLWIAFVFGAAISWGMYGAVLHQGQIQLGHPLKALLCVGLAYFLIAVLVPVGVLSYQGTLVDFKTSGTLLASLAGALGALGAVFIIWAFRSGGTPTYVMPLVFGIAPLVNVVVTIILHPPKHSPSPFLFLGFLLAAVGAGMVLYFKPTA